MLKSKLRATIQREIRRHNFDTLLINRNLTRRVAQEMSLPDAQRFVIRLPSGSSSGLAPPLQSGAHAPAAAGRVRVLRHQSWQFEFQRNA